MISFEEYKVGEGLYTARDIATILNLPNSRVRYWLSKYAREKLPSITGYIYNFEQEKGVYVNFKMFLQIYVFTELRKKGHSNNNILKMYEAISTRYDTDYPFADYKVLSVGSKLMLEDGEDIFDSKMQLSLKDILKSYIERIEFDNKGLAIRYFPLGKEKSIVVDPQIQNGSPTIKGTRINAKTIFLLHEAGDSIKDISYHYDISEEEIKDAIDFSRAA